MPLGHRRRERRADWVHPDRIHEARELISLIYEHSGIVLTLDKKSLISSRLQQAAEGVGAALVPGISATTCSIAARQCREFIAMIDEITTNKTEFFREHQHFDFLVSSISAGPGDVGLVDPEFLVRGLLDRRGALLAGHGAGGVFRNDPQLHHLRHATSPRRRCGPRSQAVYPNDLGTSIPVALRQKYTLTGPRLADRTIPHRPGIAQPRDVRLRQPDRA